MFPDPPTGARPPGQQVTVNEGIELIEAVRALSAWRCATAMHQADSGVMTTDYAMILVERRRGRGIQAVSCRPRRLATFPPRASACPPFGQARAGTMPSFSA